MKKTLYPSLIEVNSYLVMSVRGAADAAPTITATAAAPVWLVADGDSYAWYATDAAGNAVRVGHVHENKTILDGFGVTGGLLRYNGAAVGNVRTLNGTGPDANGNINFQTMGLNQDQVDARITVKTAALSAASHTHANKSTLDAISAAPPTAAEVAAVAQSKAIIFGGE